MLDRQRDLFDLPADVTYLNCAYMSPQLRAVTEAGHASVARKGQPWRIGPPDFFEDVERLRERFAALCDELDVAVIRAQEKK
jgi:arylsulfatase A-like enzyme